jgi:DNA-binding XRE family transcriptional regulator
MDHEVTDRLKKYRTMIAAKKLGDDAIAVQKRVEIIRHLEGAIKQDFVSTEDFYNKIECFLMQEEGNGGVYLHEARKKRGLTQENLAEILGISKSYIVQMEAGNKKLSKLAQAFIREEFTKRHTRIIKEQKSATFGVDSK